MAAGTALLTRTIVVDGCSTSMTLEAAVWDSLDDICQREHLSLDGLITITNHNRGHVALIDAVQHLVLSYYQQLPDCIPQPTAGVSDGDEPVPGRGSDVFNQSLDTLGPVCNQSDRPNDQE